MLMPLLTKANKLVSHNKKINLDYNLYIKACEIISKDILNNFNLKEEKIGILGLARGGLPLLVTISHMIKVRNISIIQAQMSNSDSEHDYGEFRLISQYLDENIDKYILFEDIIYQGTTTEGVIKHLESQKKEILGIYSLVIDEGFKNIIEKKDIKDIPVKYVYEINANDWVYFLWEKNINQ